MRILVFACAVLLCSVSAVRAASYYVDPVHGSDSNAGTSTSAPFKTLQKAANSTHPGDIVYAMAGTYTDAVDSTVLNIAISGTAGAPIIYTNYKGQLANIQLSSSNWQGINIAAGTQYIVINGFEVTGDNQSLTWSGANAARVSGLGNPMYNGAGINCSGSYDTSTKQMSPVAHVTIQHCRVHDCAEEGIGSGHADYITIQNNTIWNCSWYSPYCGSGISTWEDTPVDSNASTYKFIIRGNKVYNCRAIVGCAIGLHYSITDGNGIIVDGDGSSTNGVAYTGKILIANNLVYNCGGRGINVGSGHNVDVVNNTLYHNSGAYSVANTLIAAGARGAAPFTADSGFDGGTADVAWNGDVDMSGTSQVENVTAAPLAVYQSERHGDIVGGQPSGFNYTIKVGPLKSYRIILLFTEDHWSAANQRQFNVSINGNSWLTDFDIYASSGAMHKVVAQERQDTSDPNGNIVIAFTPGKYDVPKVDAIEVLGDYYTPHGEISFSGVHQIAGSLHCYNNIVCPTPQNRAVEEWNIDPMDVTCDYNLYYDGSGQHPFSACTDNHALWSDPLFVAPGLAGSASFRLKAGSPAIASGTADLAPATDLDGASRPVGAPITRGCYER